MRLMKVLYTPISRQLKVVLRSFPDLPAGFPSGTESHSKTRPRPARFNLVQIVCFANSYNPDHTRDPPVASLHLWRPCVRSDALLSPDPDSVPFLRYDIKENSAAEIQFDDIVAKLG